VIASWTVMSAAEMEKAMSSTQEAIQQMVAFQHQCDQMMFWINYKEVIVWPEELGTVSGASQAALKEKYEKFNEEITAQEVRVNEVLEMAASMIKNSHPEEMLIMRRREELKTSWQRMRKLALKRKMFDQDLAHAQPAQEDKEKSVQKLGEVAVEANRLRGLLEDCLRLQQFEKDAVVTKNWISENMVVMSDQSHLDPTNLNAKVNNHKKHEEELMTRKPHIDEIINIHKHLKEVIDMWEKLLAATEVKSVQLSQAWQQEKFNTGVDNMNVWIDESQLVLNSLHYGDDLAGVQLLIKEHTLLEADARTHRDIVDIIKTAAQQFAECRHFDLTNIQARKNGVCERFEQLQHLMVSRQRKLADSLRAQQLYRDIDVEETWIVEKEQVIKGRGQDIASVKMLIKETQAIMMEMQSHDPYVQKVIQAGFKMAEGHYLSTDIRTKSQTLADHWAELKEKAFQRKQSNQLVLLFLFNIKD